MSGREFRRFFVIPFAAAAVVMSVSAAVGKYMRMHVTACQAISIAGINDDGSLGMQNSGRALCPAPDTDLFGKQSIANVYVEGTRCGCTDGLPCARNCATFWYTPGYTCGSQVCFQNGGAVQQNFQLNPTDFSPWRVTSAPNVSNFPFVWVTGCFSSGAPCPSAGVNFRGIIFTD